MQLLQLVASQLKVDAPLPYGVRDEHGKLLLARGQMISADTQLQALLSRGVYADRDEVAAANKLRSEGSENDRLTIFDHWEQAIWRLKRLLLSVDQQSGFPERCDEFARRQMALVQRDPDIAIYLSVRQDARRMNLYGLTHSLHCALLCQLMAARMGWPDDLARSLVKAALTMNMTIIEVQGQNAVQGQTTEAQRIDIYRHPDDAVELLQSAGVDDETWLRSISEHHERSGGGGYPRQLKVPSEGATALRMADVFLAKISQRSNRQRIAIQEAARQMFSDAQGSQAAAAIIKEYGIYPPGNFVQLASGEFAVVIRRGENAHSPIAAAITDKSGMPVASSVRRNTTQSAFAIKALVPDKSLVLRLPPERLYGLVA